MKFPDEKNCKSCQYCVTAKKYRSTNDDSFNKTDAYLCNRTKTELIFLNPLECVCSYHKTNTDPYKAWLNETQGKPIEEWPPMPKGIGFIRYENGIILTTVAHIEKLFQEGRTI